MNKCLKAALYNQYPVQHLLNTIIISSCILIIKHSAEGINLQKFIQGAAFLMIASFINRILAFVYRVYTVRLVGSEGIGLYEMVFPIYSLILVLTTAGIPVAVSKLISEEYARNNLAQVKQIFKTALIFLLCSGLASTIGIIWFAPYITGKIFSDARVYWPFITAIPAIFIVTVSSVFRGYFQGIQNMKPSAASQIIEQLVRIFIGIFMATTLLPFGVEFAAAGLALGMVCGEVAGLFILLISYKGNPIKQFAKSGTTSFFKTLTRIYQLAIPITLTRVVSTTALTLQAIIIPKRLIISGLTIREATQIYGQFSGMALSLINFPTIVTISLAISLVPAISEAIAQLNYQLIKKRTSQALKISILTAIPCTVIFSQLAQNIMSLLFNSPESGVILKSLAYGCLFFYIQQTSTGILQGMGKVSLIFINVFIGTLISLGGIYWLTSIPHLGIKGTAMAVILGSAYIALSNCFYLFKLTGLQINWMQLVIKPIIAGGGMALVLNYLFIYNSTNLDWGQLFTLILIGLLVYFILLLLMGVIKFSHLIFISKQKPRF